MTYVSHGFSMVVPYDGPLAAVCGPSLFPNSDEEVS
jgi:hypothetical protein